jgi:hypothetical protein
VIVPPVTATPPSRPSGVSASGAVNPDQFDTSAVPPIDLISLVSGIRMGNGPQIIVFLILGNALLIAAIVVAARRGRRLTLRSLEWAGGGSGSARCAIPGDRCNVRPGEERHGLVAGDWRGSACQILPA